MFQASRSIISPDKIYISLCNELSDSDEKMMWHNGITGINVHVDRMPLFSLSQDLKCKYFILQILCFDTEI